MLVEPVSFSDPLHAKGKTTIPGEEVLVKPVSFSDPLHAIPCRKRSFIKTTGVPRAVGDINALVEADDSSLKFGTSAARASVYEIVAGGAHERPTRWGNLLQPKWHSAEHLAAGAGTGAPVSVSADSISNLACVSPASGESGDCAFSFDNSVTVAPVLTSVSPRGGCSGRFAYSWCPQVGCRSTSQGHWLHSTSRAGADQACGACWWQLRRDFHRPILRRLHLRKALSMAQCLPSRVPASSQTCTWFSLAVTPARTTGRSYARFHRSPTRLSKTRGAQAFRHCAPRPGRDG